MVSRDCLTVPSQVDYGPFKKTFPKPSKRHEVNDRNNDNFFSSRLHKARVQIKIVVIVVLLTN